MIPLLITMDLEVAHDHDLKEQEHILEKIYKDFQKIGLPLTIFTTSEAVDYFPNQIRKLNDGKNEIGCHGFRHSKQENYKNMSLEKTVKYITLSTNNIENILQTKPTCFRGPSMTTSAETQRMLMLNGYKSDFSVCSQRLDILNTRGGDIRWLLSPRIPYHPSRNSPYKKGDLSLWVVPLSSVGLPFISGILFTFGSRFMKSFARLLIKESLRTRKPIVYLFHSYEFCRYTGVSGADEPTGRKFIHRFYEKDCAKRYIMNIGLLKYLLDFTGLKTFTASEYMEILNDGD